MDALGPVVLNLETAAGPSRALRLDADPALATAPRVVQILAENILRHAGAEAPGIVADLLAGRGEIPFRPFRVVMQDYAGLPALLDVAAVREARAASGLDPAATELACPVDLVIDHSIRVDSTGFGAAARNLDAEYVENAERFGFLRWAEQAFPQLRVVPPGNGIVHQVNLEALGAVAVQRDGWVSPETLVGTDSHTPMIGGLGILGWGVGGLEATTALLGMPLMMAVPPVVGVRLSGRVPPGVLATDLALRLTARLRREGVVGCILEVFGDGVAAMPVPDRATLANMAPEYGATTMLFPTDPQTIRYLVQSGRAAQAGLAEAHARATGLWADGHAPPRRFARVIEIALDTIVPTVSGPSLPHQVRSVSEVPGTVGAGATEVDGVRDGDLAIAAITSCTNTANPAAMVAAGLLARNAIRAGLSLPPALKASLSPGSLAVTRYLDALGLLAPLEALGFALAGYGCMTCVGNSGEIAPRLARAAAGGVQLAAVLSGNRNFEGRINPAVRASYLASPPLVVAYALAGTMRIDLACEPLGQGRNGGVHLSDLWPDDAEIAASLARIPATSWTGAADGARWHRLAQPVGALFPWSDSSTYLRPPQPDSARPQGSALPMSRPLLILGDDVTTDHISPVGRIAASSPAGRYLTSLGVAAAEFNSYGARRGNPAVMSRGTFANPQLRNALAGQDGAWTRHLPDGEPMEVFTAAERYLAAGTPSVILAGRAYGSGSARDWAAKGTRALGVKAVIAHGFERIHRSNLALVGVLPLEVADAQSWDGVTAVSVPVAPEDVRPGAMLPLLLQRHGREETLAARCRLDTGFDLACWRAGGLLPLVADGQAGLEPTA